MMIFDVLSTIDLLLIFLALLVCYLYLTKDKYDNLPPGPRGAPIFGSLLALSKASDSSKLLQEMAKEYGPVMTVWLGSRPAIVLTGYDSIKEALVNKADYFSARPVLPVWENTKRPSGILFTSEWKEKRRMALISMRDFGLGKRSLDERIYDEARILIEKLELFSGKSIKLNNLLPVVTTNIICSIIRGDRFDHDNQDIQTIVTCFQILTQFSDFDSAENYVPWAKYIPFLNIKTWEGERNDNSNKVRSIIKGWIDEHERTFDPENIRDLIDLFMSEKAKNNSQCKDENIFFMIFDLFVAGTETTSTTLLWCMAYLIIHKDVQTKCRREIHEVAGIGKIPDISDSKNMPYLTSVINEVQRVANLLPNSLLHATSETVKLGGYTIPKGAIVIANLDSAMKDEKYWHDPHTFRPERWLDAEGNVKKIPAHIPFSTGKRQCLGELLARKELFVFLSSMLQNFEFDILSEADRPKVNKSAGIIRSAPDVIVKVCKI